MSLTETETGSVRSTRGRIVEPTPPAPVPKKRPQPVAVAETEDKSDLRGGRTDEKASDADVVRATGSMAIATLISRITGFLRNVLITATLGAAVASAFNTANTLPNLITEIVLGAVLTSLVVPVLVRAEKEDPDRGETFVRRLFTLAITVLGAITLLSLLTAPWITRLMLPESGQVNEVQATSFAFLLLPQIVFYGLFALFQAVLNTKGIFAPGAWAPVANNIISIGVLLLYWTVPGSLNPAAPSPITDIHVVLLGLGTTAGVVIQCLILVPYLRRAKVNLKPLWGVDARLKQFGGMAAAIIVYVAISQLGYVITTRIGALADAQAPIIYQQAWLLIQVPYGVIGVTLLTAIMPRLSRNAADGDDKGVVRDLTVATKLTFIALIPIVVFFTAFGTPIAQGLFQYGLFGEESAVLLGWTLSFSAFTLIPYALVLLHLRVFYAREEAWTPTFIIAGITATKIALSLLAPVIAARPETVVILLGAANGFGFITGAIIGVFLLRRKLGSLHAREVLGASGWSLGAGVAGLAGAYAVLFLLRFLPDSWGLAIVDLAPDVLQSALRSAATLVSTMIAGVVFLTITGIVLSFSGIPEIQSLGRVARRLPGLSRFIKVSDSDDDIAGGEIDLQDISSRFLAQDTFNSSPVPPPMSAGVVRGARLTPGAPVSDGRFRLLRDHGSVAGAQFWQAKENATGKEVALTFVTTTGNAPMAAMSPAESARAAAEVSRRTRRLAQLNLPGIAPNIRVLSYRSGCLVVADWIPGSDLKTVAESDGLDPAAVAEALAPFADTIATAHENGQTVGLDNRNRVRISTQGTAMLAFPAVLDDNTIERDRSSLNSAISQLVESTSPTPEELSTITEPRKTAHPEQQDSQTERDTQAEQDSQAERGARAEQSGQSAQSNQSAESNQPAQVHTPSVTSGTAAAQAAAQAAEPLDPTPREIADRLQRFIRNEEEEDPGAVEALPVKDEATPDVEERAGFGARGYSSGGAIVIATFAFLLIIAVAALAAYVFSLFNTNEDTSPVSSDAIHATNTPSAPVIELPVVQILHDARSFPDGPQAPEVIDGDPQTVWESHQPDPALLVTTQDPVILKDLVIRSETAGGKFSVFAVNDITGDDGTTSVTPVDPASVDRDSLPRIATGTLMEGRNNVSLNGRNDFSGGVLIQFSGVEGELRVRDVLVTGLNSVDDVQVRP
ncbi:murein biosynthesis protein MurJ [Corynebacterium propinquum]|uniref:Murein biosynthesis integral membrane protein MurJ n=1 Tax=Corynebacterium propinquum TaxID=43769 RepID=A0ABT7G241_9CORY|nr:murein biosynthesis integral membrane protein MurJ [Corynebacterium propinquum]MDK4234819.1 murein biosynthesis integral membrane protein MurJ [Corynebacterium propinquum]MDK4239230.1 murein biosynthesis integral membrane protein MurJ [Corynebacterium propinquum]MDK4300513.1 murein biosynthesis integral membrane protein MurJ [Corynebacterium propinquum]MDK4314099.1 murein biosynthesis integral membrane protein MurJ [Corynebacterium propinquum]RUP79062.1 murein biosynthesis protein MurJ [Cor